jgi:hypothetical protein
VEGRGDFYAGTDGHITHIETQYGTTGNANPDLINARKYPDATFIVHGQDNVTHVFTTDSQGRTIVAETQNYHPANADRSESIQQRIGDIGGPGFDGGHLMANSVGGGMEDVNVVPMSAKANRAGGEYYQWEQEMRGILENNPDAQIQVKIESHFSNNSLVPDSFTVSYRVDSGEVIMRKISNAAR